MKLVQKGELKLLWPFYLDALLSPLLFFAPAFMIIYFRDLGLNLFQTGLLLAAMPAATLFFEIPTGAVADLYGRKFSVMLGTLLEGLGFLILFFVTDFYLLAVALAIVGFGATFSSGANTAWITDLITKKNEKLLHSYFLKTQWLDSFALIFSGILGASIVKSWGLSAIWIFAAASYLISFAILIFAKENFTKTKTKPTIKNINKQTKTAIRYAKNHSVVFYLILASLIITFAGGISGIIAWIPLLEEQGLKDHAFGYLWSGMSILGILAPMLNSKIYKVGKEKNLILTYTTLSIFLSLAILLVNQLPLTITLFFSILFIAALKGPTRTVYFQRFIPSRLKATIGSVNAMLASLIAIIVVPFAGLLVDAIGAQNTIALSGILTIPALIAYLKIKEEKLT